MAKAEKNSIKSRIENTRVEVILAISSFENFDAFFGFLHHESFGSAFVCLHFWHIFDNFEIIEAP